MGASPCGEHTFTKQLTTADHIINKGVINKEIFLLISQEKKV